MRAIVLVLGSVGCGAAATIDDGAYTLVGARTTLEETMEPWSGAPASLTVGPDAVVLDVAGAVTSFRTTQWAREDWVGGCWTMQGTTAQEVWSLRCDAPVELGDDVVVSCPLALLATCPDGRELVVRERPAADDGGAGCGSSGVCLQFERSRG